MLISLLERKGLSERETEELKELWVGWEREGGLEERVWVAKEEERAVRVLLGL